MGEWLPEPLPEPGSGQWPARRHHVDPADRVTLDESVNMAFLVMLESMTAAERVAFILHDVFRYSFAEVAEIVGRTPAACRQLASSARRRIGRRGPPHRRRPAGRARQRVRKAWEAKDIDAIVGLLDPDATAVADGGGRVIAALSRSRVAEQIAHYYVDIVGLAPADLKLVECTVNGRPGLVMRRTASP